MLQLCAPVMLFNLTGSQLPKVGKIKHLCDAPTSLLVHSRWQITASAYHWSYILISAAPNNILNT